MLKNTLQPYNNFKFSQESLSLDGSKAPDPQSYERYLQTNYGQEHTQVLESVDPRNLDLEGIENRINRELVGLDEKEKNQELVNLATEFEEKKKNKTATKTELMRLEVAYRLLGVGSVEEFKQKSEDKGSKTYERTVTYSKSNRNSPESDEKWFKRLNDKISSSEVTNNNLSKKQELDDKITRQIQEGKEVEYKDIEDLLRESGGEISLEAYKELAKKSKAESLKYKSLEYLIRGLSTDIGEEKNDNSEVSKIIFEIINSRQSELPQTLKEIPDFITAIQNKSLSQLCRIICNKARRTDYDGDLNVYANDERIGKMINENPNLDLALKTQADQRAKLSIEKSNKEIDEKWETQNSPKIRRAIEAYTEEQISTLNQEYNLIESGIKDLKNVDNQMENAQKYFHDAVHLSYSLTLADSDINFYKSGFRDASFKVTSSEQSEINKLKEDKKSESAIELSNPEVNRLKEELAEENNKKGFMGLGGPDKEKVSRLKDQIKQEVEFTINQLDRQIQTLTSSLNRKSQKVKELSTKFNNLPQQFVNEINTQDYISLSEAAKLIDQSVEKVRNYKAPVALIEGNKKLEEIAKIRQELKDKLKR